MRAKYLRCGWSQFEEYCEVLAEKIILKEGDALAVLKASRDGGLFLGRMMELLKGAGIYELNYSVERTEGGPQIKHIGPFPPGLVRRNVILLTEIVNSGQIISQAVRDLRDCGNTVTAASIYYRIGSIISPDIDFIHLIRVDRAVRFKWEQG